MDHFTVLHRPSLHFIVLRLVSPTLSLNSPPRSTASSTGRGHKFPQAQSRLPPRYSVGYQRWCRGGTTKHSKVQGAFTFLDPRYLVLPTPVLNFSEMECRVAVALLRGADAASRRRLVHQHLVRAPYVPIDEDVLGVSGRGVCDVKVRPSGLMMMFHREHTKI